MIIKRNIAKNLPVLFIDSSDFITGKTGVAFGDVTLKYKKEGDSAWTTFSLTTNDWIEIDDGVYEVVFTAAMLNTVGSFIYLAQTVDAIDYHGWVDIQNNLNDDLRARQDVIEGKIDAIAAIVVSIKSTVEAISVENFNMGGF